jgi:hypothetical protein
MNHDFDQLRRFCLSREVDLTIVAPPSGFSFCLRGEFDGYGDFFSIVAKSIEYVDLPGGFSVGELMLVIRIHDVVDFSKKWSRLPELYSGSSIVFRTRDSEKWGEGSSDGIVVANTLGWLEGRDWRR